MHRIGKRVKFKGYCDETGHQETIMVIMGTGYDYNEPKNTVHMNVGDHGTVVGHEIDCGGSAEDPMHIVWVTGKGKDGYWAEELEALCQNEK